MKIVFMGTPRAAAVSLDRLVRDGHEIRAVYTQPDRPAGRGNKVRISAVKDLAAASGLQVIQPATLKTEDAVELFRSFDADIAVVVAYGRILPEAFLNAFSYGAINVHFSLLPKYRGAAPVNWAIAHGERETGVTIIQMDTGLDTGDILLQRSLNIGGSETAGELLARLSELGADLISEALGNFERLKRSPQNSAEATLAPVLSKADGNIDWSRPAIEIERRIRAFQPFPTSFTFWNNTRLTVWRARLTNERHAGASPGVVIGASDDELLIGCADETVLAVTEIQPEGKRRMTAREFLNGAKLEAGTVFHSMPATSGTA
jgi:methionyl-tRNA formyltransferase